MVFSTSTPKVQRCIYFVVLEKCEKNEYLVAKIGFDTAESDNFVEMLIKFGSFSRTPRQRARVKT